jgi:hydroxypyruvate isomerase
MAHFPDTTPVQSTRRQWLAQAACGAAGAAALGGALPLAAQQPPTDTSRPAAGRLRQSIVHWCFADHWSVEQMLEVARQLGCQSVELIAARHFPQLKAAGLECAIASVEISPGPAFARGWNTPDHWPMLTQATRRAIDACAEHGFQRVIAFTGMRNGLSDDQGMRNCVEGLKQIAPYAEEKGVTICLEMLNSRDDSHPMKGHPGYQGDHLDYCLEIIHQVDSPQVKLLLDIYHVQIMDGDVIRRIRRNIKDIAHIHTAGNPGRCELDERQELNYRPIMQALADSGYQGFVGHEFIPTRDPREGLQQAVEICSVAASS